MILCQDSAVTSWVAPLPACYNQLVECDSYHVSKMTATWLSDDETNDQCQENQVINCLQSTLDLYKRPKLYTDIVMHLEQRALYRGLQRWGRRREKARCVKCSGKVKQTSKGF